jgi:hypothetical protein
MCPETDQLFGFMICSFDVEWDNHSCHRTEIDSLSVHPIPP